MLSVTRIEKALILLLEVRRGLLSLLIFLFFSSRVFLILLSILAAAGGPWVGPAAGRGKGIKSRLEFPYLTALLASLVFVFYISLPRIRQLRDQVV